MSKTDETKTKPPADKEAATGRVCKEEVRWAKRTYAPGETLPANVPAETIARLEELGFV